MPFVIATLVLGKHATYTTRSPLCKHLNRSTVEKAGDLRSTVPDKCGEGQQHTEGQRDEANPGRRGGRPAGHQLQQLLGFFFRWPKSANKICVFLSVNKQIFQHFNPSRTNFLASLYRNYIQLLTFVYVCTRARACVMLCGLYVSRTHECTGVRVWACMQERRRVLCLTASGTS